MCASWKIFAVAGSDCAGAEILPADLGEIAGKAASGEWTDALREWASAALANGEKDIHARARDALDQTCCRRRCRAVRAIARMRRWPLAWGAIR
jgi:hypothetical protein